MFIRYIIWPDEGTKYIWPDEGIKYIWPDDGMKYIWPDEGKKQIKTGFQPREGVIIEWLLNVLFHNSCDVILTSRKVSF